MEFSRVRFRSRERAGVIETGETGERCLDREGDALLRLQRRVAGRFGIDLHLDVGDVGHRIDRKAAVIPDAQPRRAEHEEQDQPAMSDRCTNDFLEHVVSSSRRSEERRVGKEWVSKGRARLAQSDEKKKLKKNTD